jgi:hypothetical protein
MEFFDIHDQTKYQITVSKPNSVEELSDLFVTKEELDDLCGGNHFFHGGNGKRTITLKGVIATELTKLADELQASGKKTIPINDEELLAVLKTGYLVDFMDEDDRFGRHGDRICYARRWKRKKVKATQGDVRSLWNTLASGFQVRYGCYPSHIPIYDRHLSMFKAFKKIVGWRAVRNQTYDKETAKFFRQIWDNPEEFIK